MQISCQCCVRVALAALLIVRGTVSRMPNLSNLAAQSVNFTSAYMPSSLCGPSRAMLFSGGYRKQNTGVLENELSNGGATVFHDKGNLGAALQAAGYRTERVSIGRLPT